MPTPRTIHRVTRSMPTIEGAGVKLNRAFGFGDTSLFDPFLLLDAFGSDNPRDYEKGFPWHPHRGIETITYVLDGEVEHADSLGNAGIIGPGSVQWMTAGSGIVHHEMPLGGPRGRMRGFQLWANLPRTQKMMDPRYRDVSPTIIPEASLDGGSTARVIAGTIDTTTGPVGDVVIAPLYLDVAVPARGKCRIPVPEDRTCFAYVFEGEGYFDPAMNSLVPSGHMVVFDRGDSVEVKAGGTGVRFLLVSGKPLGEPIAWYGPIVMNTQEEIAQAMEDYRNGTFVKAGVK